MTPKKHHSPTSHTNSHMKSWKERNSVGINSAVLNYELQVAQTLQYDVFLKIHFGIPISKTKEPEEFGSQKNYSRLHVQTHRN